MEYVWDKVELLRAAKRDISKEDLVEEIWMGLPDEMRLTFDNEEEILDAWDVQKLSNALIPKDRAFRATLKREAAKKESSSFYRTDRSSSRFGVKPNADDRRKLDARSSNSNDKEKMRPSVDDKKKWRKDDNGKWMSRACRHCGEWHLDSDCPKKPSNYYLIDQLVADSDAPSDEHDIDIITPETESDSDSHPHYHTMTNGYRRVLNSQSIVIKDSGSIPIIEVPQADVVGTGIAYLSAEPCPVRASLGAPPDADTPVKSGVVDSGGACIIAQENVPAGTPILRSPLNPSSQGVGDSSTETIGYAKIPTYFPNHAAFNEDKRHAKILLLWIEYQIVAKCKTAFLIGRDALKAYSIDIEESSKNVVVRMPNAESFRIPITETDRLAVRRHDSRVFLTEDVKIKPHAQVWLPIDFSKIEDDSTLFFSPCRFVRPADGTYGSSVYALFSDKTNHILFLNPSDRPMKLSRGEVVGSFEPLAPNSPAIYFNDSAHSQRKMQKVDHTLAEKAKPPDSPTLENIDPFGLSDESGEASEGEKESDEILQNDDLEWDINPRLKLRLRIKMLELLRKRKSAFAGPTNILGRLKDFKMRIQTNGSKIRAQAPYRSTPRKRALIREAIQRLKTLGVIRKSSSSVASPVVVVWQKGKPRFCVDLREVNSKTEIDRYPIPRQDNIFARLSGAKYMSTLDAFAGYHQSELEEESRHLTAFITEDDGLWEYLRVPFGLKNAPAFFQRCIDEILGNYRWDFVLAYIDDIVVFSNTFEEHLVHVDKVLDTLTAAGLTLSEKKCHFGYTDVRLLGHKVSRLGLSTQEEKVEAITKLEFPKTVGEARVTLGEFGYHRSFIDEYAILAEPLTSGLALTEEEKLSFRKTGCLPEPKTLSNKMAKRPFQATTVRLAAFDALKIALSNAPVLIYPDYSKPFLLYVDACRKGIAAGLYQVGPDEKEHPVLFISRTLRHAEKNYAATELECLAVVWALKKLAHYVDGSQLTLITDHSALKWIWSVKETVNQRLFRWSLLLNPLKDKVNIVHRPGRLNNNVDPLSRNPVPAYLTTTLVSISNEWRLKLQSGYVKDKHFRSIWKKLGGALLNGAGKGTQSDTEVDDIDEGQGSETTDEEVHDNLSVKEKEEAVTMEAVAESAEEVYEIGKAQGAYSVVNGLLYMTEGPTGSNLRLCVPSPCVNEVIKLVHSAAHVGIRKTFQSLSTRYYFPRMSKLVKAYVNRCGKCQTSKPSNEKTAGKLQPIKSTPIPSHTISVDFVTGLPESNGSNALLNITDKFSKAVKLIPCRDTTSAKEVACLYYRNAYSTFGLPTKIISDRDARFTSGVWQALCQLVGISLGLTAAYHPLADGQGERTNQTVENSLRCLIGADVNKYSKWTDYLLLLEHELNSTPQSSTNFTPNELRYIIPPRSIPDVFSIPDNKVASVEDLMDDLKNKRDEAKSAIRLAQDAQKEYADTKRSDKQFAVGDLVLLKFKRFSLGYKPPKAHSNKLGPTSTPVRIIRKISPLAYKVALPAGSKIHDVISIIHLKKYRNDTGDVRPLPIEQEGTPEWEVEHIEDERVVGPKRTKEYLVKWAGYGDDERTWEPVENLEHAQSVLLDWITKHPDTSAKTPQSQFPRRKKKPTSSTLTNKVNLLFYTPSVEKSPVCRGCSTAFSSRNRLFKHLHNATGCLRQGS